MSEPRVSSDMSQLSCASRSGQSYIELIIIVQSECGAFLQSDQERGKQGDQSLRRNSNFESHPIMNVHALLSWGRSINVPFRSRLEMIGRLLETLTLEEAVPVQCCLSRGSKVVLGPEPVSLYGLSTALFRRERQLITKGDLGIVEILYTDMKGFLGGESDALRQDQKPITYGRCPMCGAGRFTWLFPVAYGISESLLDTASRRMPPKIRKIPKQGRNLRKRLSHCHYSRSSTVPTDDSCKLWLIESGIEELQ